MASFPIQIMAMDRLVFEGDVEHVMAKGTEGFLGVLAHHAPLVTELDSGVLEMTIKGTKRRFQLEGGLLEVGGNAAVILADGAVEEL